MKNLHKSVHICVICVLQAVIFLIGCEKQTPNEIRALIATTFDAATAKGTVLVYFWAVPCPPCEEQKRIIAEIASEVSGTRGGVVVASLDLTFDEAQEKVKHLNIEYAPTLILFKNGKPFKTFEGLTQKTDIIVAITHAMSVK